MSLPMQELEQQGQEKSTRQSGMATDEPGGAAASRSEVRVALAKVADALVDEFDPTRDAVQSAQQIVDAYDLNDRVAENRAQLEALGDLGREKTTKEEKITAIVQYAQNVADDETSDRELLKARDIKGLLGVSRRYAYDLIDDLPEEHDFLLDRRDARQYGELEMDNTDQRGRGLVVDLDALHNNEAAVNKFTTRSAEKEVSA